LSLTKSFLDVTFEKDVQEVLISTSVDTAYVLGENNTDDGVANGTEEESSENI